MTALLSRRIAALESRGRDVSDGELAATIMGREPDVTAWLLTSIGDAIEKAAMWTHLLKQVDGRSKGLPQERTTR